MKMLSSIRIGGCSRSPRQDKFRPARASVAFRGPLFVLLLAASSPIDFLCPVAHARQADPARPAPAVVQPDAPGKMPAPRRRRIDAERSYQRSIFFHGDRRLAAAAEMRKIYARKKQILVHRSVIPIDQVFPVAIAVEFDNVSCFRVDMDAQEPVRQHVVLDCDRVIGTVRRSGRGLVAGCGQRRYIAGKNRELTAAQSLRRNGFAIRGRHRIARRGKLAGEIHDAGSAP